MTKTTLKKVEDKEDKECDHVWMYSTFCDRGCNTDFETWLKEVREKVTVNLILVDLWNVLKKMRDEKKITAGNADDLYVRMKKYAVARDYLKWTSSE